MEASRRLERLILYHLWACVPFGLAWAVWPGVLGVSRDPGEVLALRLVMAAAVLYLAARSWIVLKSPAAPSWRSVWPIVDVLLISVALLLKSSPATSWLSLLYLFPITQAAATLRLRWAVLVGVLAAALYLLASGMSGVAHLRYAWAAFRLFFLVLMASLLTHLARTVTRAGQELAVSRYREDLSREMHDGIQHYLAAISAKLSYARTLLRDDPDRAARLALDQRYLVSQVADELRYLVRRLRSPQVEQQGFVGALKDHLELFADRTHIDLAVRVEGRPASLPPDVEHAAFRIVQEALTNIEKHAQADRVTVEVDFTGDRLRCVIADDGVGFDGAAAEREPSVEGGVGLHSMRERAASVGGTLRVESEPGQGTEIVLKVPLPEASQAREGNDD